MNNNLTIGVRVNSSPAERGISRISKAFQRMDNLNNKIIRDMVKLTNTTNKFGSSGVKAGNDVTKSLKNARHELTELSNGLNRVIGLYGAFAGVSALVNTSDSMTSAQNKLNYLNSELLGENGTTTDASGNTTYSDATLNATQEQLDKMYTSSQKVRTNYADMMANVSKSMTLAPDAFGGNVDNAIRFQEIMAEAYTLGGASAQEMHSSMYQMIQALGSGILAGDELRSVREGAPLAYKEIEKFAQGLYDTDKSLKDLASDGQITSDIVVAAMMRVGDSIDAAFALTDVTYAQAWTMIKNAAIRSFQPVFNKLNEFLNSEKGIATIKMLSDVMADFARIVNVVVTLVTTVVGVIAKNWSWLQYIFYALGFAIMFVATALTVLKLAAFVAAIAVKLPFLATFMIIALLVGLLVACLSTIYDATATTVDNIYNIMMWLANFAIAVIAMVLVAWLAGLTIGTAGIALFYIAVVIVILALIAIFIKFADKILGVFFGCVEALKAIWENFKIAFHNVLVGLQTKFWNFVNNLINEFKPFLEMVNAALSAMGKNTIDLNFAANKLDSLDGEVQAYVSVSDAYQNGYSKGSTIGKNIQDAVNKWGDKLKNPMDELNNNLNTTDVGNELGKIGDDTSKIKDSMDLTKEDLEYLRKIAAMEWKKEYTTANITVDMKNYNQIEGSNDLDGLVTQLSSKLRQELDEVANGVYV